MCDIAGFMNLRNEGIAPDLLEGVNDAIAHRGQDNRGYVLIERKGLDCWNPIPLSVLDQGIESIPFTLGLGRRRFRIIDLSWTGRQPMGSQDGNLGIVHNGETYNYVEIHDQLQRKGYRFESNTDTEFILKAYGERGEEFGSKCPFW